jgi:hypothetical protein
MIPLEVSRHAPGDTKQNHEKPQDNGYLSIIMSIQPSYFKDDLSIVNNDKLVEYVKQLFLDRRTMGLMSYKARIIHPRLSPDLTYLAGCTFFSTAQGNCGLLTKII